MQLDEVREPGELWKYESYRPNTPSPTALSIQGVISFRRTWTTHLSPQLEESLHRGGGVILIVIVCVSEDGSFLFEETIYDTRPPQ